MREMARIAAFITITVALLTGLSGCTASSGLYEPGSTTQGRSGSTTVVIHSGYYGRGWGYPGYYPGAGPIGPPPVYRPPIAVPYN